MTSSLVKPISVQFKEGLINHIALMGQNKSRCALAFTIPSHYQSQTVRITLVDQYTILNNSARQH